MPVYEYRCTSCNKVFEYQQRMSEPAKTVCEECAGALERLISRSSFSFKGGGWYKDLYATPKSDSGTSSPSTSSSDSSTSTSTSTESSTTTSTAPAPAASTGTDK